MTAKKYLEELRGLRSNLRICRTMADNCHIRYDTMRGMDYSADKVQSSPKNGLEQAAWRMMDDRESYIKEALSLEAEINKRLDTIKHMSKAIYSEILYKRYWDYKDLRQIAKESGYGMQTIYNFHKAALNELDHILTQKK